MTENKGSKQKALDRLADALIDDILNASPEEVMAEFEEDHGGAESHVNDMRALIEKSVAMANKQHHLAAAKAGAAASRVQSSKTRPPIDFAEARRLMSTLTSGQKLTLAARKESEQSEDDLLSMIDDLRELGVLPPDDDSDGTS